MTKQDRDMGIDDMSEDTSQEPRVYELGFHLDPELPTEEVKKAYQTIRALIEDNGTIVVEGEPQKIQLAYTIARQGHSGGTSRRDFDSAYFSWIVYEAPATRHAEILSGVSADKHVIRFIDLLTTKDAARHSAEMREISLKTLQQRTEDQDEVAGTELDAVLENVVV